MEHKKKRKWLRWLVAFAAVVVCVLTLLSRLLAPRWLGSLVPGRAPISRVIGPAGLLSAKVLAGQALAMAPGTDPGAPVPPRMQPSAFADFERWAAQYLAALPAQRANVPLAEGIKFAQARREAMAEAIRANPKQALAWAASWRWYQELPQPIVALLEERASGRGRLDVYCAEPLPGADYKTMEGGTIRYVTLNQKTCRAYVYGRRVRQMSKPGIALHGVAVGNVMAVSEEPFKILRPDEAQAVRTAARGMQGHGGALPAKCSLCGSLLVNSTQAVLADYGGQWLGFCNSTEAGEMNRALARAEESIPAKIRRAKVGDLPTPANPLSSYGAKKVLYLRVVFADDSEVPIGEAEAASLMATVNDFYVEASYNKTALISTISPVLTLAQAKMYYAVAGPGTLAQDAEAAARAAGYDPSNYDFVLIRHTNVPGFTWAGLAGGGLAWLQSSSPGVTAHELGHDYGLGHANAWDTRRAALPSNPNNLPFDTDSLVGHDNIIGAGDDVAYGDPYDIMGSGGGEAPTGGATNVISSLNGHFNVVGKWQMGWLPQAYITTVSQNGTNRIYAHDTPQLMDGRAYALNVRKDEQRTYWVSARSRFTDNPWLLYGVELHWGPWQQALGYSQLLDTTPGSKAGVADGSILIGRTYNDPEADLHITPVAQGGTGTETWFDVVVNVGPFPTNLPPVVDLTVTNLQLDVGNPTTFTVNATDPNGDVLAYHWDFGDGTVGLNSASITKTWTKAGDYVVRCEVSDMKGGVTSRHVVVTVGTPQGLRINGHVLDTLGNPLPGVRVSNGSLTNNDYADDYQWTYTDSDGSYSLVNLSSNTSYTIGAYLNGYVSKPLNFTLPVNLTSGDAVDASFLAQALPHVTVKVGADASTSPAAAGNFQLTRTGDPNTTFRALFLLGGTATTNDYQGIPVLTNLTSQTNLNPNPFGAVTSIYQFHYVDFAPGIVTTNLTVKPSATSGPGSLQSLDGDPNAGGGLALPSPATLGGDKYVDLTLMYALQARRTTLISTNSLNFTGWEVRTIQGQDTWFQTDPDYIPALPSDAKLYLKGPTPTLPLVSIVASGAYASKNEGDAGLFTLTRFGRLDLPVTVALQVGGTARAGSDYEPLPTSVTIPAGQSAAPLPVFVQPNFYLEGNKTVTVTITPDASYLSGNTTASVTILDRGMPLVTLQSTDNVASEATAKPAMLEVTRTGDLSQDLVVNYLVTGTAVSGQDYVTLPNAVTIPAGQPSATISVTSVDNGQAEGNLTVVVFLSVSPTYNIGSPDRATVVIQDAALPTVTILSTNNVATVGGGTADFIVSRAGDVSQDLWVDFQAGGSAKPLGDYAGIGNRVRIASGASQATITITPMSIPYSGDPLTVSVGILPSTNYNVGTPSQATVTILNNNSGDPAVSFALLSSTVSENVSTAQVAVVVSGNPLQDNDVTVDWKVTGGSAKPGVDFPTNSASGRLVFKYNGNGGANAFTNRVNLINIPILNHTNVQPNRTIVLTLLEPAPDITNEVVTNIVQDPNDPNSSTTNVTTNVVVTPVPMNAFLGTYTTHTLTIVDDDASVVTVQATNPTANEEAAQPGLFTIRRTSTNGTQRVYFQLSGNAVNGSDYEQIDSPLVIPAGFTSITVPIVPIDDEVQEYRETVKLTLLNVPGATIGAASTATISLVDTGGTIEFTDATYAVPKNVGVAQIGIRRTKDTNAFDTVEYLISAGTASDGTNFVATNGTVTFYPGETRLSIPVTILDDHRIEAPLTVKLTLLNGSDGAPLGGQSTALLSILDDHVAVAFAQPVYRVNENGTNAVITVRRVGLATNAFTVDFTTTNARFANGTARPGVDYMATSGTLSFGPGQTEARLVVSIIDNTRLDGNRALGLQLLNPTGPAVLGSPSFASLVIVDDECYLEFVSTAQSVEEYGRTASVAVRRVGGTVNTVTVNYATKPDSAKPNRDYLSVAGTLTFNGDAIVPASDGSGSLVFQPGDTNQTISIPILDNTVGDGDRQFQVALSNPAGLANTLPGSVTLGTQTNTVVTILDDEMPGNVDFAFNPGQGTDGNVLSLALQADGKVLLGGEFGRVNNVILTHVARLQSDGYLDSFLNPGGGTDSNVLAVVVQSDGRVLIGGDFSQLNGVPRNRIARLNGDGTVDDSFDPGDGPDGTVRAISLQADGAIVIGGDFATIAGINRNGIARLNPDGSLDGSFDPRLGANGGAVLALASLTNGMVLVGGSFRSLAGANNAFLARLDGSGTPDTAFALAGAPDAAVRSIAVQPDGRIVIGGDFGHFGAASRNGIARLNADGSLDAGFDPGSGANDSVFAVGTQADGKIYFGGAFTNCNGVALGHLGRLNPDGSIDDTFDLGSGANDVVRALVVQSNSALLIGGDFTQVRGLTRNHIARIHGDDKYVFKKVEFNAAQFRVLETAGQAAITVQRSGDTNSPINVVYLTAGGTAKAGVNYLPAQGTLQFASGENQKTFNVPVLNDGVATGDLTVGLLLTNLPAGYSLSGRLAAALVIGDIEGAFDFGSTNYLANESDGLATITVLRSGTIMAPASVQYATQDGTAVGGLNYTPVHGTLFFAAGMTNQALTIPILNDNTPEADQSLRLILSQPQGGPVLGLQSQATLTIHDDDQGPTYRVEITPPAGGTVTPAAGSYPAGSVKSFTATPNLDFTFAGWEGTVNSTANPLSLLINQNYTLTAAFLPKTFTYTFEPPFSQSDLASPPWNSTGDVPWQLESVTSSGVGQFALQSGAIGDSQESTLELLVKTRAGAGSFDLRVSSEANWDFLEFSVNGTRTDRWSGEVPWQTYVFPLQAGWNRLDWRYAKDATFSFGLDRAFIDNLYVPLDVPAVSLNATRSPANGVLLELQGPAGATCVVQASSDLIQWQAISTNRLDSPSVLVGDPATAQLPVRFYRAFIR